MVTAKPKCPKCKGTGQIFSVYRVGYMQCYLCEGSGYVMDNQQSIPEVELKRTFIDVSSRITDPKVLVVVVQLPNGALETITNTYKLDEKIQYYTNAYDERFKLKTNPNVQIVGFILV